MVQLSQVTSPTSASAQSSHSSSRIFHPRGKAAKPGPVVETRDDPDLPKVTLAGDKIFCEGRVVDLGRSELMVRLFTGYCRSPTGVLTRADTFLAVYGVPLDDRLSARRRASMIHNMVKLVSRARSLVTREFNIKRGGHRLAWFVHDSQGGHWTFRWWLKSFEDC
jgi:hypothetical protein